MQQSLDLYHVSDTVFLVDPNLISCKHRDISPETTQYIFGCMVQQLGAEGSMPITQERKCSHIATYAGRLPMPRHSEINRFDGVGVEDGKQVSVSSDTE